MSFRKVAVLIAAFNGEKYLEIQLDSILSQKNVYLEIFISLDKSTDNSFGIINKFINMYPKQIYLISSDTTYGSPSLNFYNLIIANNIEFNNYDYICFSDQDDIWNKYHLSKSIAWLENGYDVTSCSMISFSSNHKYNRKYLNKTGADSKYDFIFESGGAGCTYVIKINTFLVLRYYMIANFDSVKRIWSHDWFIFAFCRGAGFKWKIRKTPTVYYRQHNNNSVGANIGFNAIVKRLRLILNLWYKNEIYEICNHIGTIGYHYKKSFFCRVFFCFNGRRKFSHRIFILLLIFLRLA